MALPIFGLYMQKVYKDSSLPYSEDEVFDIPEGFDPCRSKFLPQEDVVSDSLDVESVDEITPSYVPVETHQEDFDDIFE